MMSSDHTFNGTMYHFHDDTKKNTSPINTRCRFYKAPIYKSPISSPPAWSVYVNPLGGRRHKNRSFNGTIASL